MIVASRLGNDIVNKIEEHDELLASLSSAKPADNYLTTQLRRYDRTLDNNS